MTDDDYPNEFRVPPRHALQTKEPITVYVQFPDPIPFKTAVARDGEITIDGYHLTPAQVRRFTSVLNWLAFHVETTNETDAD